MDRVAEQHARVDVKAAAWAGVVAGVVFLVAEMAMVALFLGQSPWGPPRMIAAMAMGREVLPPPATFDFGIMMVAMIIHFVLSIVLGIVFAFLAKGRSAATATVIGVVFGIAVYLINFYGMTAVFPWFAMARNWVSLLAHALFGAVLGYVYSALAHRGPRPH